jgi:hypothetical protein
MSLSGSNKDRAIERNFHGTVMRDSNGKPQMIPITIKREVHEILETIPHVIPTEVSGMGKFIGDSPQTGVFDRLYFPKNKRADAAFTRIDGRDWAIMIDAFEEGGEDATECARVWWHSHVNMEPNPSGTDISTMLAPATDGENEEDRLKWTLNIITSTNGMKGWLIIFKPIQYIFQVEFKVEDTLEDEKNMGENTLETYLSSLGLVLKNIETEPLGDNILLLHRLQAACADELKNIVRVQVSKSMPSETSSARIRHNINKQSKGQGVLDNLKRRTSGRVPPFIPGITVEPIVYPFRPTTDWKDDAYAAIEREAIQHEGDDVPPGSLEFPFYKGTKKPLFDIAKAYEDGGQERDGDSLQYCPECYNVIPQYAYWLGPEAMRNVPWHLHLCSECEEPTLTYDETVQLGGWEERPLTYCGTCWTYLSVFKTGHVADRFCACGRKNSHIVHSSLDSITVTS